MQVEAGTGGAALRQLPSGLQLFAAQGGPLSDCRCPFKYAGHTPTCCPAAALLVQGANLQSMLAQHDSLKVLLDFNMPCTQVSTACMLRWQGALSCRTFYHRSKAKHSFSGCQVPAQQPKPISAAASKPSGQSGAQQPTGQNVHPMLPRPAHMQCLRNSCQPSHASGHPLLRSQVVLSHLLPVTNCVQH